MILILVNLISNDKYQYLIMSINASAELNNPTISDPLLHNQNIPGILVTPVGNAGINWVII